jgi:hypothetical protein
VRQYPVEGGPVGVEQRREEVRVGIEHGGVGHFCSPSFRVLVLLWRMLTNART